MAEPGEHKQRGFTAFASSVAYATGKPVTFIFSVLVVVVWAATGPLFRYSDTWQLVINTGTTIVTFLMVFLIQNTQNRDGAAIQAKLDELIRASAAQNRFIGIEKLSEEELTALRAGVGSFLADRLKVAQAAGNEASDEANAKASDAADRGGPKAKPALEDARALLSHIVLASNFIHRTSRFDRMLLLGEGRCLSTH